VCEIFLKFDVCLTVHLWHSNINNRRKCLQAASSVHYTTSCKHSLVPPVDGRNYRPKHVELIEIIKKLLLFHVVGCLYYYYFRSTEKTGKVEKSDISYSSTECGFCSASRPLNLWTCPSVRHMIGCRNTHALFHGILELLILRAEENQPLFQSDGDNYNFPASCLIITKDQWCMFDRLVPTQATITPKLYGYRSQEGLFEEYPVCW